MESHLEIFCRAFKRSFGLKSYDIHLEIFGDNQKYLRAFTLKGIRYLVFKTFSVISRMP